MRKFSKRDLDRSWSLGEVGALFESELTRLAFLRDYKNLMFFVPADFVFYLVDGSFGVSGKIVGWAGVPMFGAFAPGKILFIQGVRDSYETNPFFLSNFYTS